MPSLSGISGSFKFVTKVVPHIHPTFCHPKLLDIFVEFFTVNSNMRVDHKRNNEKLIDSKNSAGVPIIETILKRELQLICFSLVPLTF